MLISLHGGIGIRLVYFDRLSINLWLTKKLNGMCKIQIFSIFLGGNLRMWGKRCNFAIAKCRLCSNGWVGLGHLH